MKHLWFSLEEENKGFKSCSGKKLPQDVAVSHKQHGFPIYLFILNTS